MNGVKPPGRSRPTNNQLLYKAHFRWKHYTQELAEGTEQPEGTEACASVTSAFLQVLATVHNVECSRLHKPRNILHILSTNTRRTKVVELSTGTHRVADELRRHSLSDGEGGHYSTNLDRNRYGSDNNYLFTVTRYNLECLGLCPCLVDIEIVDTRNGNESQLVTAGEVACSCNSPERAELADISHYAGSNPRAAPPSPHREMRRVASAGTLNNGGLGMRRVPSSHGMRRNPSTGRLYEYGGGNAHPTHSRGSGGSDLFDALLMAATGDHDVRSHGEPPVSSHAPPGGRPLRAPGPGAGRAWAHGSHNDLQDSLHNAVEALRGAPADEEDGAGPGPGGLARLGSGSAARGRRGMPRRNSVSMIVENPVLAQTGAGDSLIVGQQYYQAYLRGEGADGEREHSGEGEGEGDTDHGEDGGGNGTDQAAGRFRGSGLLRQFQKQHSAVNLTTLGVRAAEDVRRFQDEVRQLREETKVLEVSLEEAKSGQKAAERSAEEAGAACRRAAETIEQLRAALAGAGVPDPTAAPDAAADERLRTSEQEIELLRAELADVKTALAKAHVEKKEAEGKFARASSGPGLPRGNGMPPPSAAAAAAAAAAAFHMPYAMGMLPMFGMPPLNPFQGLHPPPQPPPSQPSAFRALGSMQKVASMPAMHHGIMSPPADRDAKRKADSPIVEGDEGAESPPKRQAVEGIGGPEPAAAVKPGEKGQVQGQIAGAAHVQANHSPADVAMAMGGSGAQATNGLAPSMTAPPGAVAAPVPAFVPAQI